MAQYIPYIQDQAPEPVLYQPDWGMIGTALQKKDYQYQQGINQLRQGYGSILNAPLSNSENIPVRDQYVKQAQESLKKISGADLSLPENVQAAQNIFEPFWNDPFIVKDANYTQWYQSQQQKLASWRDSQDPKVRSMYSPVMEQYLNQGLNKLQTAKRTPEGFSRIERREAIPFTNVQEWLQDRAKDQGLKIDWTDVSPDGAYLIDTTNGQKTQKKFSSWAEGMMGDNFNEQFKIEGRVRAENVENYIKSQPANAGLPPEQIRAKVADYVITNLKNGYEQRVGKIDSQISSIDNLLKSYPANISDPAQAQKAQQLLDERRQLASLKDSVSSEYGGIEDPNSPLYKQTIQSVLQDPTNYFGTLSKQSTINNWATARAEVESRTIKENSSFFKAQDIKEKYDNLNFQKQKEADLKDYRDKLLSIKGAGGLRGAGGTGAGGGGKMSFTLDNDGNVVPVFGPATEGEQLSTGARVKGLGSTDITTTPSAYDVFMNYQGALLGTAHDKTFNPESGAIRFLTNAGLSDDDVMQISSGLKRQLTDGENFSWNPKEVTALDKLAKSQGFSKYWKDSKVSNIQQGILNYAKDYVKQKHDNNIDFTDDDTKVLQNYLEAKQANDMFVANEDDRQNLIKNSILTDPKTYGKITVDRDGKKDLIQQSDVQKFFKDNGIKVIDKWSVSSDPEEKVSLKDLSRAFMQGKVKFSTAKLADMVEQRATIDGTTYAILGNVEGIKSRFGSSEDFSNLYMKANTTVVPHLKYFENKTARMGTVWGLNLDDYNKDPQGFQIVEEALLPSNQLNIYAQDKNGNQTVVDNDTRNAIKMLLGSRENIKKYLGNADYYTQGVNGNPTLSFNIKELSSSDKNNIGGVDLNKLNTDVYKIEISPEAKGPNLRNLPQNSGNYVYQKLLQGESMHSDDMLNSYGISYDIVPNNNTNPTGGSVTFKYNLRTNKLNPTTGQMEIATVPMQERKVFSFEDVTPDQVVGMIHSNIVQLMMVNQQASKQYEQHQKSSNAPSFNLQAELNKLGIK